MKKSMLAVAVVAGSVVLAGAVQAGSCGSCSSSAAKKSAKQDVVDTAVAAGSFNTLVAAVKAAGLADTLKGAGPFTVFAPTDEAFGKLPAGTVESLLKPENLAKLQGILKYHVVAGKVTAEQASKLTSAATVQGSNIRIEAKEGSVKINEATVVKADVEASNGVIHVIDQVILPPVS